MATEAENKAAWDAKHKAAWLANHKAKMLAFYDQMGWETDEHGDPLAPWEVISAAELAAAGKTTMAHVMADLNLFESVGEAKRNGWKKPVEPGEYFFKWHRIRIV